MIMPRWPSSRQIHLPPHFPDAAFQPTEDRLADQEMADIEFGDLRNGGDRGDIVEGQAVAGMGLDSILARRGN